MKIKEGLFLHKIADECIIMQDGTANIDFSNILNLNPTAAWLWTEIGNQEFDADKIVQMLTNHYEVTEEQARRDAEDFVKKLVEAGVTE